jgi:hypothetical protein
VTSKLSGRIAADTNVLLAAALGTAAARVFSSAMNLRVVTTEANIEEAALAGLAFGRHAREERHGGVRIRGGHRGPRDRRDGVVAVGVGSGTRLRRRASERNEAFKEGRETARW